MRAFNRIVVGIVLSGMILGASDAAGALRGRSTPVRTETAQTEHLILAQFRGGFGMRMPAPAVFISRPPVVRPPIVRPPTPQVTIPSVIRPPVGGRPGLKFAPPGVRSSGAAVGRAAAQFSPRRGLTGLAARISPTGMIGRGNRTTVNIVRTPRVGLIRSAERVTRLAIGRPQLMRGVRQYARTADRAFTPGRSQRGANTAANDNIRDAGKRSGAGVRSAFNQSARGTGRQLATALAVTKRTALVARSDGRGGSTYNLGPKALLRGDPAGARAVGKLYAYSLWRRGQVSNYPPNNGFYGKPSLVTLQVGQTFDRYGSPWGKYGAPQGTPFARRALPREMDTYPLTRYRVVKPIKAWMGPAAPWFGQRGGAAQYMFRVSISKLEKEGYIERIE